MIRKFCDRCSEDMTGRDGHMVLAVDDLTLVVRAPEGTHFCQPCIRVLLKAWRLPEAGHSCTKCGLLHPCPLMGELADPVVRHAGDHRED